MIIAFIAAFISFLVLDFLWLGFVVKDFNLKQLSEIGRIVDGDFQILYGPAVMAYVFMTLTVVIFVLPLVQGGSWTKAFFYGALMGLFAYGIFDMTNLAILKNYPVPFSMVDMAWGTFVFGATTVITKFATEKAATLL